jgi:hypothetical protein
MNGHGCLPPEKRLTLACELKRLAQRAFGYAASERRLRHALGFEPDERTTLRHLCAPVRIEQYEALVVAYMVYLQATAETDAP